MLERVFPNIYGWLVWGGGFYTIAKYAKVVFVCSIAVGIFALGYVAS